MHSLRVLVVALVAAAPAMVSAIPDEDAAVPFLTVSYPFRAPQEASAGVAWAGHGSDGRDDCFDPAQRQSVTAGIQYDTPSVALEALVQVDDTLLPAQSIPSPASVTAACLAARDAVFGHSPEQEPCGRATIGPYTYSFSPWVGVLLPGGEVEVDTPALPRDLEEAFGLPHAVIGGALWCTNERRETWESGPQSLGTGDANVRAGGLVVSVAAFDEDWQPDPRHFGAHMCLLALDDPAPSFSSQGDERLAAGGVSNGVVGGIPVRCWEHNSLYFSPTRSNGWDPGRINWPPTVAVSTDGFPTGLYSYCFAGQMVDDEGTYRLFQDYSFFWIDSHENAYALGIHWSDQGQWDGQAADRNCWEAGFGAAHCTNVDAWLECF